MSGHHGGHGPPPKPRDQRVRTNKDPIPLRLVHVEPEPQPDLPEGLDWHPQTIKWWRMWRDSPLSAEFTATDWSELTDTANLHSRFWYGGNAQLAGELRLRAAKFGATPEDRARLRIQVVTADEVEKKAEARSNVPTSRNRYQAPQVG